MWLILLKWNEIPLPELSWALFRLLCFKTRESGCFVFNHVNSRKRDIQIFPHTSCICRWRNKCDQVLLWQLVLGLIGAVHNLSPSAVHNLRAKVAPSQKHICHYSVGAGEGAMLQSRICHDGGGEVLQYFHLLLRIFCLSSWRPNSLSKYPKISISRSAVLCSMINPVLDMVSYRLVDLVSSNSLE